MGCGNCGSGAAGCKGGGLCSTGGCGQLDVHDWLADMGHPAQRFDGVEVKFKGGRKEFFRNVNNLELFTGDPVVVDSSPGHHVGFVSAQGEIVRLQMRKKKVTYNDDLKVIYRLPGDRDIEKFEKARSREMSTLYKSRELITELKLGMKLSDVEFQADNTKATFYYSAEDRVDFRELIKRLATEFKVRVEMRQISLRQEASRLGGIGSCGRELCCSTWLTDFKSVSTSSARYQNLSLNPGKLSGQCGRLKCCLNYELDTYLQAIKDIPEVKKPLQIERGPAFHQKTDIFKRMMWFSFPEDNNWYPIDIDRVNAIQALNELGEKPYSLELDKEPELEEGPLNDDLLALDDKYSSKKKKKKKKKPRNQQGGNRPENRQNKGQATNKDGDTNAVVKEEKKDSGNNRQRQGNRKKNNRPQNKGVNKPQATADGKTISAATPETTTEGTSNKKQGRKQPNRNRPNNKQGGNPTNKQGAKPHKKPTESSSASIKSEGQTVSAKPSEEKKAPAQKGASASGDKVKSRPNKNRNQKRPSKPKEGGQS